MLKTALSGHPAAIEEATTRGRTGSWTRTRHLQFGLVPVKVVHAVDGSQERLLTQTLARSRYDLVTIELIVAIAMSVYAASAMAGSHGGKVLRSSQKLLVALLHTPRCAVDLLMEIHV